MIKTTCPNCGTLVTIDEEGYAEIVRQVRGDEFNKELQERIEAEKKNWEETQAAKKETEIEKAVSEKEKEIGNLRLEIEKLNSAVSQNNKDTEIAVKNAVSEENSKFEKKIKEAEEKLSEQQDQISQLNSKIALDMEKHERELERTVAEKDSVIADLNAKITNSENEHKLELNEAVSRIEKERDKEKVAYEFEIKKKDEEIERLNDHKLKLSTKMVGETLEKHCETQFNQLRPTAFRNAYFEKDNDSRTGSKGDYIYRELDENGIEILSIMFEMKNEMDTTDKDQKHHNEDFFKKLDKDRTEKKCEYAVLVTLLEADSELYTGITDVSYRYEKMYVIRPQFFIPMITLLRNAALNSLQYKRELASMRAQNIDITNFEDNLNDFKGKIKENYRLAGQNFHAAIKDIEDTIKKLEKTKKELELFEKNLRIASEKAEDITIKKLTKGNPTMIEMFKALPDGSET